MNKKVIAYEPDRVREFENIMLAAGHYNIGRREINESIEKGIETSIGVVFNYITD